MTTPVSSRIMHQRLRNRIMEALEVLAMGNAGVRDVGAIEFFEVFYDFRPHRDHGPSFPNSAIDETELKALEVVSLLLDDACDATPKCLGEAELIESGWPSRIRPVAESVLSMMEARGRFSEEVEEIEPTPTTASATSSARPQTT